MDASYFFEKRMFGSNILMESNIMNRSISDYMVGLDALLESERIKEEIFKELPEKLKSKYISDAQNAKKDNEGEMVEAADAMDTMLTSLRELNLGNKYFAKVFDASVVLVKKYEHQKFVKLFLEKGLEYRKELTSTAGENI